MVAKSKLKRPEKKSLEILLRQMFKTNEFGELLLDKHGESIESSPEFRIGIKSIDKQGVHFLVHAHGHASDTLDFCVKDNSLNQE